MLDRLPRHSNVIFQLISLSFLLFVMLLFEFFFLYAVFAGSVPQSRSLVADRHSIGGRCAIHAGREIVFPPTPGS